jgi:hypothetical protein
VEVPDEIAQFCAEQMLHSSEFAYAAPDLSCQLRQLFWSHD